MNHENYNIISKKFHFSEILINLLLYSNLEIAQMILRIFYFICTILNLSSMNKLYDVFRALSILIKECSNDVSFQIMKTLNELLIFDFDVLQPIYIETDIYLSLQMKFLSLLNINSNGLEISDIEAYRKKDQQLSYLIKILKLLLKNNNVLISSFLDIGHFEILLNNLNSHKKLLNPFIIFFLDEEAKNVNLQPYLDFLIKKIEYIKSINDYTTFFNISGILTKSLTICESKKVFREAILKRFGFFMKFFDSICYLRTFHPVFDWDNEKQKIFIKSLIFLKKYLMKSSFLRRYFKEKNLFCDMIERFSNVFLYFEEKTEDILLTLLDLAVVQFNSLPLKKVHKDSQKCIKQKDITLKSWNYFKTDSFFLLFPEILKYTIEFFIRKCELKTQISYFEIINNLCKNSINRNIFNKIGLIDSMNIIYHEIFQNKEHPIVNFYLSIFFLVCEGNFNRKLAVNLGLIIDHNMNQVNHKPFFF